MSSFVERQCLNRVVRFVRVHKWWLLIVIVIGVILALGPTVYANLSTRHLRYDLAKTPVQLIPKRQVVIVFGAGVLPSGEPTPYLRWRVQTAVTLYKAHRVQKVLMSGDNSSAHYNEPVAMAKLAEKLGVPKNDIVLDYAGFNTYDSCYRARVIFKVSSAIVVSQGYHLPRAVMTCNSLGVSSLGVDALHTSRDYTASYIIREWASTDKAVLQLITHPKPTVLGGPEPISAK
ncbi:MAG: ElyC/SanA/YdcF family protein [Candidatus Saccharimonadales bacterium]